MACTLRNIGDTLRDPVRGIPVDALLLPRDGLGQRAACTAVDIVAVLPRPPSVHEAPATPQRLATGVSSNADVKATAVTSPESNPA